MSIRVIKCTDSFAQCFAGTAASEVPTVGAETFGCVTDMTPVRRFFVSKILGNLEKTPAVVNAGDGIYPEDSVVQLVPAEVMVKRADGFSVATKGWEFFDLGVSQKCSRNTETMIR